MASSWRFPSLDDFLTASELTVDGQLDDGWGADVTVKGREIDAAILFGDISGFSSRTSDLTPVETLVYVNTFFTWITAEALRDGHGIIDKYIGDEVMVVFAREFGSEDPFVDAVQTARRICEHDVLDYQPHIGIASGVVVVGYVGTPLAHNCSVFGAPVALAARCAGVAANLPDNEFAPHCITFPAASWGARDLAAVIEPQRYRDPETGEIKIDDASRDKWRLVDAFATAAKNLGEIEVRQVVDAMSLRINNFTVEDRAREGVKTLRESNRYWPDGRDPELK